MGRYRLLTAGVLVVGVLATGLALAQGPRGGGPGAGRGMRGLMGPGGPGLALGGLNLSEAQREQIRDIRERSREQTQEAARRLADVRDKQRAAIEAIPADESLIRSLTQDMVQAELEVALQAARLNTEVWAVLTPEQQAQATKLKAERQSRMDERRQRMEQRRAPR